MSEREDLLNAYLHKVVSKTRGNEETESIKIKLKNVYSV